MANAGKKGMVPEEVQQLAKAIEAAKGEIQQISKNAQSQLTGLDWTGADQKTFLGHFEEQVTSKVQQVIQKLDHFSQDANKNAQEQIQTSSK